MSSGVGLGSPGRHGIDTSPQPSPLRGGDGVEASPCLPWVFWLAQACLALRGLAGPDVLQEGTERTEQARSMEREQVFNGVQRRVES